MDQLINQWGEEMEKSSQPHSSFIRRRIVLQPVQVIPTVPPSFTGSNTGAEVAVAPSGRLSTARPRA
jgi:6-phosphogluconolactonase (cycloisomerase 2 family)